MDTVAAAIIGGLFTLVGVFLNHHLAQRREKRRGSITVIQEALPEEHRAEVSRPAQVVQVKPKRTHDFVVAFITLLIDFAIIVVVVNAADLIETEPAWENVFAFFVLGAIPVYAMYRLCKGLFARRRSA